jgi:outer membrane PBP1 activator LpoA protein
MRIPTVPLLALNRTSIAVPSGSASFSLSPEDDGIAAAEFLLARNAKRVLVLTGNDEGMRRAAAALRDRLAERGGAVVESLDVGADALAFQPRLQASVQKAGAVDAYSWRCVRRKRAWSRRSSIRPASPASRALRPRSCSRARA